MITLFTNASSLHTLQVFHYTRIFEVVEQFKDTLNLLKSQLSVSVQLHSSLGQPRANVFCLSYFFLKW